MRHLTRLTVAGLAAGLAVSACGSTNVLHGKSAPQIVQLAGAAVDKGSYRMAIHGTVSIDTSGVTGLPAAERDQVASLLQGITIDGKADVESPQRMRFTMTLKPLLDKQVVMVLYDGAAFFSEDGGKTFADAGSFNFSGLPVSPSDQVSLLKDAAGSLQDRGATTRDGVSVEQLHAVLGQDYLEKVLGKMGGGGQIGQQAQQFLQLFLQAMEIRQATADAYVGTADGTLRAEDVKADIALDMGKLVGILSQAFGGKLPGGSGAQDVGGAMVIKESATSDFSDYGARITVAKPTVDPNAPSLPSGGGLFGA